VRAAAAKALGAMRSTKSISMLSEPHCPTKTFLFAWRRSFLDPAQGKLWLRTYYDVLAGERKAGKNLFAEQMNDLKDPEGH